MKLRMHIVRGSVLVAMKLPNVISDREFDVWRLIARGHTQKDAADRLGISHKTVGNHVEHLKKKLTLDPALMPLPQLVLLGVRYRLVDVPLDPAVSDGLSGEAQNAAVNCAINHDLWAAGGLDIRARPSAPAVVLPST